MCIGGDSGGGGLGGMLGPIGGMLGGLFGGGGGGKGGAAGFETVDATPPAPPKSKSEQPDLSSFQRPGEMAPPTFLGINSSMDPSQQATRAATLLTQGEYGNFARPKEGLYANMGASDALKAYYKNLALRQYTDPSGNVLASAPISDVEWQMMDQLYGPSKNRTAAHYLTRLSTLFG